MAGSVYLEVDASELNSRIELLRSAMTEKQFNQAMYGIMRRTGGHVRNILKKDLPKQYEIKPGAVGKAVQNARVSTGTMGVGCTIPVVGPRLSIGSGFKASGGAHGWNSLHRRYRVKARIVRSATSTLPGHMSSYGGMPPFRNLGSKLGKLTFTRAGKSRLPIMKISGIAIPQMPTNRSEGEVQGDIKRYMERQIEQRIYALLLNGR